MSKLSQDALLTMCCLDSLTTYEVMLEQEKLLSKEEVSLIQTLLLPLVPCLNSMEKKGVLVDIDTLAGLYGQMGPIKEALLQVFAPINLNPASPIQICRHFGLRDSEGKTLKRLIDQNAPNSFWYEKILAFRRYDKVMSTYLKGIYDRLEDGYIHTHFKLEGTGTGRLASENPNLQNIPEHLKLIYIPEPGKVLVELDFKQLELRVMGVLAEIPSLLQAFEAGGDPHEELRQEIFGGKEEGLQRSITKTVLFGALYGQTPRSLGLLFKVSDAVASRWQERCIYKYPEIIRYRERSDRQVQEVGYLITPFGRKRYITEKRKGYNFPVQSSASDVCLTGLLKLFQSGFDIRSTVHDSVIIQAESKEEMMEAKKLLEEPFKVLRDSSFPVKVEKGPNWGDLKEVI